MFSSAVAVIIPAHSISYAVKKLDLATPQCDKILSNTVITHSRSMSVV